MKSKLKKIIKALLPSIILDHYFQNKTINKNIYNENEVIEIGKNVTFADNLSLNKCVFGSNIKIGQYSYLDNVKYGNYSYNAARCSILNCEIGNFCSIAIGVNIGLGIHPLNSFVSTSPAFYSVHRQCGSTFADKQYFDETGNVVIGNDVWIGANAVILDNVKIGDGSVIAANSVVNRDVPSFAIVGGSPAKIIKYRFNDDEIIFLNKFKWWNKSDEWLKSNFKYLHDINLLIEKFNKD